jgi:DNA-binding NarL/FixJ family response regulator
LVAVKSKEVRYALKVLISQNGNKDKIIEVAELIDLLIKLKNQKIRIVIIEWEFFYNDTIEMVTLFKKAYKDIKFVIIGIQKREQKAVQDANIDAFYLKSDSPKELINIINEFRDNQ